MTLKMNKNKLLINDDEYIGMDTNSNINHCIVKYLLTTKKDIKSVLIDTNGGGYVDYEVTHLDYPFTLTEAKEVVFPNDTTIWEFVYNQREDISDALIAAAEKKIYKGINELIKLKEEIQNLYYLSTQNR